MRDFFKNIFYFFTSDKPKPAEESNTVKTIITLDEELLKNVLKGYLNNKVPFEEKRTLADFLRQNFTHNKEVYVPIYSDSFGEGIYKCEGSSYYCVVRLVDWLIIRLLILLNYMEFGGYPVIIRDLKGIDKSLIPGSCRHIYHDEVNAIDFDYSTMNGERSGMIWSKRTPDKFPFDNPDMLVWDIDKDNDLHKKFSDVYPDAFIMVGEGIETELIKTFGSTPCTSKGDKSEYNHHTHGHFEPYGLTEESRKAKRINWNAIIRR